jgi:transposase
LEKGIDLIYISLALCRLKFLIATRMTKPGRLELDVEQLNALLDRIEQHKLTEVDYPLIADLIRSMAWLSQTLEDQSITIHRLRKIFGFKTERTSNLPDVKADDKNPETKPDSDNNESEDTGTGDTEDNLDDIKSSGTEENPSGKDAESNGKKPKREGNKFSAKDYKSAIVIKITHKFLTPGCRCPDCQSGNLRTVDPGIVLRIIGQPWLQAHIYERERFRCNTCGKTFTAKLPEDVARAPKYDNTAKAIVCLLKYRGGFPFYRQESLQTMLETPISDNVLWEMTRDVAMCLEPIFETLIAEAAKGECLHNDDTKARILDLIFENKKRKEEKERTGIYTSAILSKLSDRQIALFFTGRQHAGENLDDVLDNRPEGMATPTQMCDASNNNSLERNKTDESNCHAHLRRKFFEIAEIWPTYILPIIAFLNTLFSNEREAKEQGLDDAQTFEKHKEKSAPIVDELKRYCQSLIDDKKTEPNSNLGKAINYMFNHWEGFTLFLRKPGVPIDNNADERLMKRSVLNRKNGLFFKTQFGAYVGDILLSVIETCQLNKINPYHYLIAVQTHKDQIKKDPSLWLPWNYEITLSNLCLGLPAGDISTQFPQEISPEMTASSLSSL